MSKTRVALAMLLVGFVGSAGLVLAADEIAGTRAAELVMDSRGEPEYPPAALHARFDATIDVVLEVHADGSIGDVVVEHATHTNLGFEESAIDAVKGWDFRPAHVNAEPVDSYTHLRLNFRTRGGIAPSGYVTSGVLGSNAGVGSHFGQGGIMGYVSGSPSRGGGGGTGGTPNSPGNRGARNSFIPNKPSCGTVGCVYDRRELLRRPESGSSVTPLPVPVN